MEHALRNVSGYWDLGNTDGSFHYLRMAAGPESQDLYSITGEASNPEQVHANQTIALLFDEMHASMRRYVIFLGFTPEDADDSVQEAFLRLYKHLRSGGDESNVRGWLFQVVRNIARDKRKGIWRRRISISRPEMASIVSFRDPADSAEDRLLKEERLAWLRAAMERLTPHQAECVRLRASGLRYREIAVVMGIGISAVGELVQRAMARLNEESNAKR
jgi:RNA polymerase sigma-70 factor (ECF subfamily)